MIEKSAARKAAFQRRKAAHGKGLDAAAQDHLTAFLSEHSGKVLAGYMPIRTEINPLPVMAGWGGDVCVPVIEGEGKPLVFHRWTPATAMQDGPFGASVPAVAEPLQPEVLIVPLVAFGPAGQRLGYGGGFYDRTLAKLRAEAEVLAIGFAYSAQEDAELPQEETDARLDAIATESGVIRIR